MTDSLVGQTLGKYTIIEKIGRGGMAEVYKAYQENLDRYVAVKVMHSFLIDFEEEDFLKRFSREAKTMASFNHPHIVRVYDFDSFGPRSHYLVMDYLESGSLKDRLETLAAEGKRMPLEQSIKIITDIADALAYAHRRDMVHRDIKPANILLDKNGEPYLTDFGIVKIMGGQTMGYTVTGALIGTPSYMSPEQALGKPGDKRSDLYSLGIMLFQMVTGKLPFDADTPLAAAMKHVSEPVPLPVQFNPDVPQALQAVILKALAKDPDERFQSAGEMAAALRHIDLSGGGGPAFVSPSIPYQVKTEVLPPTQPPRTIEPAPLPTAVPLSTKGNRRWLWIGLVVLLLAIGGGTAVLLPYLNRSNQLTNLPTTPSPTEQPTDTAVPTATITPTPEDTPDVVQTTIAIIVMTSEAGNEVPETAVPATPSAEVPEATNTRAATAVSTKAAAPTNTPRPTTTPTATRSGNSTGTAQTGSGLPYGFETFGTWVRGDEANGTFTQTTARVHGGSAAGQISYDFGSSGNDYVVFLQLNSISGTPNTIQLWVYGDGSGHYLNVWILDSGGETWQVPLGRVTHTGWQQMTGYIATGQDWPWGHISGPTNDEVDYPITFRAFVLDDVNNSYTGSGTIYLDDLTVTTSNIGSIPTAQPVSQANPTATTAVSASSGNAGRIIYTSGSTLLTTDPAWSVPQELGSYASDSCSSPATTITGQSFNLYYGNFCTIGATGTGVCASPNGQYEVLTSHNSGSYSVVVRPAGSEELRFVYQGSLDLAEGIRWSPLSDSFLFVMDDTVNRAFPGGSYSTVATSANTPIFSQNGSQILFRRPVGPGVHDIFVVNADGSGLRNVTNVTAVDKRCAAWRN